MQFPKPMAAAYPTHAEKAILKAEAEDEEAAVRKAKAEEAAFIVKAKAEEEAAKAAAEEEDEDDDDGEEEEDAEEMAKARDAAFLKAMAKEEMVFEWDDDKVPPYDKVYHESDEEEDMETIMARIEARWDVFMKEEEARFPNQTYWVHNPGEYSVDESSDDSDNEQKYYLRKMEREKKAAVNVVSTD